MRFGRFPSDVGYTRLMRVPKRKVKANSIRKISHALIIKTNWIGTVWGDTHRGTPL